jgi:hypothetical protein
MLELYRPSLRAAGAIAVLLAWVASLGWLAARRLGTTEETTLSSEATLRLAPGTLWYALYAGSTQVGNAAITLDTLSPGYRIREDVTVESRNGAGLARSTRRTEAWLGATLNLQRLHSDYSREGRRADWNIVVVGDTIAARFVSAAIRTQGRSRLADAPTASIAVPYRLALGGEQTPRRTRTVRLLDGWPAGARLAQVAVGRDSVLRFADSARTEGADNHWVAAHMDSVRAFAVTVNGAAGPRRVWVDHRGAVIAIETPFGLRWMRTDFDLSKTEFRRSLSEHAETIRGAVPIIGQFAAPGSPRDTATTERRFLVEHRDGSPVDTSLLVLLSGGRQSVNGDTITVDAAPLRTGGESIRDTTPDPMVQQDAGAIGRIQRALVAEPLDRERLPAFMTAFRRLARVDTSAAAPEDALGTLGAKVGRPDGVTRLFVALLRASGVPARYVVGVYPHDDTMLTHAWAEIWSTAAGGWYAVDPVSGAVSANTGLIRLAFGGSSHPDEMLAVLANARLTEIGRKGRR